ncbi:hypothetical protein FJ250_10485, partial [bacterium]|nr:hypothetical protein [bacterium]
MSEATALELLERISEAIVFIDPATPAGFAPIAADLDGLSGRLGRDGRVQESAICANAAHLAHGLAAGIGDPAQVLKVLTGGLDALRASLVQACHPEDAGFPTELAPGTAAVPAPTAAAAIAWEAPAPTSAPSPSPSPSAREVLSMVDESIMSEFLARQSDVLEEVENELLSIEDGTTAGDLTGLLRFFHTLKGESALLGMSHVAELCHAAEDMMQAEPLAACVERLLVVKDWLMSVMRHYAGGAPEPAPVAAVLAQLRAGPTSVEPEAAPPAKAATEPGASASLATAAPYEVVAYVGHNVHHSDTDLVHDFVAEAVEHLDASEAHLLAIEKDPHETEALNAVFRAFHTIKGLAGFVELDHIKDLAHKAENLLDMARRGALDLVGANMDLVFESVDLMKRLVEGVAAAIGGDGRLTGEERLPGLMARLVAATVAGRVDAAAAAAPAQPAAEK